MAEFVHGQRVRHLVDGSIGTVLKVRPDTQASGLRLAVYVRWDNYRPTWNLASMLEAVTHDE